MADVEKIEAWKISRIGFGIKLVGEILVEMRRQDFQRYGLSLRPHTR